MLIMMIGAIFCCGTAAAWAASSPMLADAHAIPEPATAALVAMGGLIAIAGFRHRHSSN
ncbi:MAG: PEP-CTERM sorting domain-containing protein [Planctomycetaceae bacterium]|nr:PEP-CTERM sorting domain-containing protein [Planctomycetaceae bacterium]